MGSFLTYFGEGIVSAVNPISLCYIAFGVIWGIIGGATPGVSASIAMALLLPMLYGMDPMLSLPMLSAVYVGAEYGGSIPAILIKTPGTAAAGATVLDGYTLQQKGQGGKALIISLISGVIGGIISVILLVGIVVPLAKFALKFGPTQYFWLSLVGLSLVGGLSGDSPLKGLISACFGLFLASIGMDEFTGTGRFTFGSPLLLNGMDMVAVMVGLFAVGDVFLHIKTGEAFAGKGGKIKMVYPTKNEIKQVLPVAAGCGALGTFVGAMPGAGATIASWMGYSYAKLFCKDADKTFGTGDVRGVAAPESANNAVPAGALIPLLALGIPGSNSTAMLMAGFTIAGISCGPTLFINSPSIPYGIMACMLISQVILLAVGLFLMKPCVWLTSMNKVYLIGAVLLLSQIGAFATANQIFTMVLVVVCGVIGYFFVNFGFSPAAAVLGFVLGDLVEHNIRRSLQLSNGSVGIFFKGGINIVLILLVVFSLVFPYITKAKKRRKETKATTPQGESK